MFLVPFPKSFHPLFFLLVAIAATASGCTVARIYATGGNEITVTETDKVPGEVFTTTKRVRFEYGSDLDIQGLLRSRFGVGNRFQNVTVTIREDLLDLLLNRITLGIANSRTYEVSGIRLPKQESAAPK